LLVGTVTGMAWGAEPKSTAVASFKQDIQPLLAKYCYDCHADGVNKGKVAFDVFATEAELVSRHDLWLAALKNVRAGIMPPLEEGDTRPSVAEIAKLAQWVKYEAFGLNAAAPDPGRVTVRRLNRSEYRNTINDLMGVEFNSEVEFPPDDTGNGFDNIGDVLTVSPLLLEKYLQAAETIVERAVPKVARVMPERVAYGKDFRTGNSNGGGGNGAGKAGGGGGGAPLLITKPAKLQHAFRFEKTATYQIAAELEVRGSFDFDPGRGEVICFVDGKEWFRDDVAWQERKVLRHEQELTLTEGSHTVSFEIVPEKKPGAAIAAAESEKTSTGAAGGGGGSGAPSTRVDVRIVSVQINGPLDPKQWVSPANYTRFFPKGPAPESAPAREKYARELLGDFAQRAYRRPVEAAQVNRLVEVARETYKQPGKTFEEGIGRAMMAVLASPRFLFRSELPVAGNDAVANVDDYTLASRLSYFLWSSMPDAELFTLAGKGQLRPQMAAQVKRMLADPKAQALVKNFIGQWLQVRDVESVPINARVVLGPNAARNKEGRIEFDGPMRRAMRSETEMTFSYVLKEDRSVLELLDSNYTFLNERLAKHYGIPGVTGDELHLVTLPEGSPRGGVLTQGSVLAVTSNPTRTSPVKRGLFVLDNILGVPPPPPPPDIPALEESEKLFKGREPKLSEILAAHRSNKMCSSCHERMDPLGLAFENFTAMGTWRDKESRQTIEVAGKLVTGEKFASVSELKHVLTHERRFDYYRCLTEKLLTFALGRGLDYHDVETIDRIVDNLERNGGRMSVLLNGVIESAPFQKLRRVERQVSVIPTKAPSLAQGSP
jgi:hypothetical protein